MDQRVKLVTVTSAAESVAEAAVSRGANGEFLSWLKPETVLAFDAVNEFFNLSRNNLAAAFLGSDVSHRGNGYEAATLCVRSDSMAICAGRRHVLVRINKPLSHDVGYNEPALLAHVPKALFHEVPFSPE